MKIAVLADIHVRLVHNREFEVKRFTSLMSEVAAAGYHTVVIAGDLFDFARPSLEEIKLVRDGLISLLRSSVTNIFIIAGNHEAVTKANSTYDYLEFGDIASVFTDITTTTFGDVTIKFCPWNKLSSLATSDGKASVLISHFRSNYGPYIKEEVKTKDLCKPFKLTILGDIHHRHSPLPNVVYTGSPYSTKFVAVGEKYGFLELDTDTLKYRYIDLDLPSKYKFECTPRDIVDIQNRYSNHLLKLVVTGTTEELESLVKYPNVIYSLVPLHRNSAISEYNVKTPTIDNTKSLSVVEHILKALPTTTDAPLAAQILSDISKEVR